MSKTQKKNLQSENILQSLLPHHQKPADIQRVNLTKFHKVTEQNKRKRFFKALRNTEDSHQNAQSSLVGPTCAIPIQELNS